jgi:hypothetical protein
MSPTAFCRDAFDELLAQHQRLIELANELEFHLYSLSAVPPAEPVQACQETAGALLGALRDFLFRQDQQVLPILDALSRPAAGSAG